MIIFVFDVTGQMIEMSFALCFEFMEALMSAVTASCSEHFALQTVCSHKTRGCGLDRTVEYGAVMSSVSKR